MKKPLPRWLAFMGFVLLLIAAGNWTVTPLKLEDGYTMLRPIEDMPLDALNKTKSLNIAITIPQSASWQRLRREFGAPGYLVGIESARNLQECFEDHHLRVTASKPLDQTAQPVYGHSLACQGSPTFRFHGEPGETVNVNIAKEGSDDLPPLRLIATADLVTKERLNNIGVDENLRKISTWIAWAGAALLALGGFLLVKTANAN